MNKIGSSTLFAITTGFARNLQRNPAEFEQFWRDGRIEGYQRAHRIFFEHKQPQTAWILNPHKVPTGSFDRYPYSRFLFRHNNKTPSVNGYEFLSNTLPGWAKWQYWDLFKTVAFRYDFGSTHPVERAPVWRSTDDPEHLLWLLENADKYHWNTVFLDVGAQHPRVFIRAAAAKHPSVRLFLVKNHGTYSYNEYAHFAAPMNKGPINPYTGGGKPETFSMQFIRHFTDLAYPEFENDERLFTEYNILAAAAAAYVTRFPGFSPQDKEDFFRWLVVPANWKEWVAGLEVRPEEKPLRAPLPLYGGQGATDKFLCDSCSLAATCPLYRVEGGLCRMEDSLNDLVLLFGSRDVETVQNGLARILQIQASRYMKQALAWDGTVEEMKEEPTASRIQKSKHLLEMENSMSKSAEVLVQLMDPTKRGQGTNIQILNANGLPAGASATPAQLAADVVRQLEEQGVDRSKVTPAMINAALGEPVDGELVD